MPYPPSGAADDPGPGTPTNPKPAPRLVTQKSIVLLKNANQFLPLDKSKLKSIAVVGPLANEVLDRKSTRLNSSH